MKHSKKEDNQNIELNIEENIEPNTGQYIDGQQFHTNIKQVYKGKYGWAINKQHKDMAKVVYHPAHENLKYQDERRGHGRDFATWVFSEEQDTKEQIFTTGLELFIDATLEPDGSIGLHYHTETEEIYYILAGSILMTTVDQSGEKHTELLSAGDAHVVKIGQGHYGTAGAEGVRFITVAMRASR